MSSDSALPPASTASGTQVALYRAALGPVHAEHYLPVFARFDERGASGPAWSTAAAVGGLGWLVYRQLWGAAGKFIVALGVWALIAAGLALWFDFLPLGVRAGLALALLLLLLSVPGLYGTALLHKQISSRMIAAVQQAANMEEACTLLRLQSDAHRRRGAWGVAGLLLAVVLAGWAWMAWPKQRASPPVVSGSMPAADTAPAAVVPPGAVPPADTAPQPPAEMAAPSAASAEPVVMPAAAPPAETSEVAASQTVAPTGAVSAMPPAVEAKSAINDVAVRVRGYGVSVGLFGVAANAARAKAKLEAAGLPVLSDPIESARGPLTRVRVGPFESRDQAQAAAKRVLALGLDARVYAQ